MTIRPEIGAALLEHRAKHGDAPTIVILADPRLTTDGREIVEARPLHDFADVVERLTQRGRSSSQPAAFVETFASPTLAPGDLRILAGSYDPLSGLPQWGSQDVPLRRQEGATP